MFGKTEWFRIKAVGWGLRPVTWQGWTYAFVWAGVIVAPFVALLSRHQAPEALVWFAAAMGTLLWDVRQHVAGLRSDTNRKVLYIRDDGGCEPLAVGGKQV